jgi:hypothetical protein
MLPSRGMGDMKAIKKPGALHEQMVKSYAD